MSKATLKKELDKLEKIVLELPCMQTKQVELPPQPDADPIIQHFGENTLNVHTARHSKRLRGFDWK